MNTALVPKRAIFNTLGCICNDPSLLIQEEVNLSEKDFGEKFYQVIFVAMNNLIINNIKIERISAIDIDNVLAGIPQAYKIFELNNGLDYLASAIENANKDAFEFHYKQLKKFTLLRDFDDVGFDIKEIFDYENIDMEKQSNQLKKFEKLTIDEIIEHFNLKMLNIKNVWNLDTNKKSYEAKDGIDTLIEELRKNPDMGYPFASGYYNAIFRGMQPGKLFMRSAGTGVGKTRLALADISTISACEIFNLKTNSWEKNEIPRPSSFISTELELQELQTCLIACISGVSEDVVKNGRYSEPIEARIRYAIEVIKKSSINLHYIDDFSISDIEQIIEKDILEKDVKYVFFDYIQITPKLSRTMQESYGMALREDQLLVNFASRLKLLANKYQIFLSTSTQLNRGSKEHENRDPSGLRGGQATADKVNSGVMCFKTTQKDIDNLKHILERGIYNKPNFCHYIYKNRGGRSNLIIWTMLNHGNMRFEECFVTDMDYNLITDIKPLQIKIQKDENNIFD